MIVAAVVVGLTSPAALSPVARAYAGTNATRIDRLQAQVENLKVRLDAASAAEQTQTNTFSADATDITIASGVGVVLIGLAGLAAAGFGYRFIQSEVRRQLTTRIDAAIHAQGDSVFQAEAESLRAEYDERLAELYRRANASLP